jgi:ABC-type multidrug transport system fused ATPase/permease subunit
MAVLCLGGFTATGAVTAHLGRKIIDDVLLGGLASDEDVLQPLLAFAVLLTSIAMAGHVLQFVYGYLKTIVQQSVMHDLREDVYASLRSLPDSAWDDCGAGDVMSRNIGDTDALGEIVDHLLKGAAGIASVAGVGVTLFMHHWRIAAFSLAVMMLSGPTVYVLSGMIRRRCLLAREARGGLNHFLYSKLLPEGADGGRPLSREPDTESFHARSSAYKQRNIEAERLFLALYSLVGILTAIAAMFSWIIGGGELLGAEMTVGTMMILQVYIKRLGGSIKDIGAFCAQALWLTAPTERIYELLDGAARQEAGTS